MENKQVNPLEEVKDPAKALDVLMQAAKQINANWDTHVILQTAGVTLSQLIESTKPKQ